MHPDRINELANEVRLFVFAMMDAEPEITGDEAGRVAAEVERTFRDVMVPEDEEQCREWLDSLTAARQQIEATIKRNNEAYTATQGWDEV